MFQTVLKVTIAVLLFGWFGFAVVSYEQARAAYKPEVICDQKTDTAEKQKCLNTIAFAQAAGD